jgi:hypothetical protein
MPGVLFCLTQNERKEMEIINEWFYGQFKWVVYNEAGILCGLFNQRGSAKRYVRANG